MLPKLLFVLIFLFTIKTLNANPPNFLIFCMKQMDEMNKLDNLNPSKVPHTEIVSVKAFSDYIFGKINFLENMVKFLINKYTNFFDDISVSSMRTFLNYNNTLKKPRFDIFMKMVEKNLILVGRSNVGKYFDVLEGIQTVQFQMLFENFKEEKLKFEEMKRKMNEFIDKLKIEIIYGQPFKDFNEMKGRIEENQIKIDEKIKEADEVLGYKQNIFGKLKGNKEKKIIEFENANGYNPADYKALFLKYKHLNDASLELYNELIVSIPNKIEKRARDNTIIIEWNTILQGKKFKNAFDQIVALTKTMFGVNSMFLPPLPQPQQENLGDTTMIRSPPSPARPPPKNKAKKVSTSKQMPGDYVDPEEAANRNFDEPTFLDYIEYNLSLPPDWLISEAKLLESSEDNTEQSRIRARAMVRLNAGVLLMALERLKKCF